MENVILTNMCMIENDRGETVVQLRKNVNWPGLTFPGGHVEVGESFHQSVIREVKEETGLTIYNPYLCGVKQFPLDEGGRYIVLFYKAQEFKGELVSSDEGSVFWLHPNDFLEYPVAPDFMEMLKIFQSASLSEFYYQKDNEGEWQVKLY